MVDDNNRTRDIGFFWDGGRHYHIGLVGDVSTLKVSIFSKSSRTAFKTSVKIPEQAS